MSDILDTTLRVSNSGHGLFFAEAKLHPPIPMGVTVVGSGTTIKAALIDLANALGDSLDPDTEN